MPFFDSMRQSLNDPNAFHAMTVHLPIALGIVGALLAVAMALVGFRSRGLAAVTALCFLAASAGALVARSAGEDAAETLENPAAPLTVEEHFAVEEHEEAGENLWIWTLVPGALAGMTVTKRRRVRLIVGVVAVAAAFAGAGATIRTAHLGGVLVYQHGLGAAERTPGRIYDPAATQAAEEAAEHEGGER